MLNVWRFFWLNIEEGVKPDSFDCVAQKTN